MNDLYSGDGSAVNRAKIGGTTTLLGNPAIRTEKPHTIVCFPGGDVEIARTSDGRYWVHVATRTLADDPGGSPGRIVDARIDAAARYADQANEALRSEIDKADVRHIAFLVEPPDWEASE